MKARIKVSLFTLTAVYLLALLRNVVAKLTGNANFPTPPVSLAAMTTKGDELEAAIEEATNGSKASKEARNGIQLEVKAMLESVAAYVTSVGKGDPAILSTSGFELAKQPEPIGVPGVAKALVAEPTNSQGTVELRWRRVRGAHSYRVWMTDSDPTVQANWTELGITIRSSRLVADLESYKPYWFKVSAIGYAGEGKDSDPAMGRAA